jgi:hypothetical protein
VRHNNRPRRHPAETPELIGATGLTLGALGPTRSRWTWRPALPDLWLHEHASRQLRELIGKRRKED